MPINTLIYGYMVREEEYPDKATIIKEGAEGDWVYVVLEGKVKVKKQIPKGLITIDTLREGAIFGEMALLEKTKGPRTATIVADGPVKVGLLDRERLDNEFEALSTQLRGLIKALVSRLENTTKMASLMAVD